MFGWEQRRIYKQIARRRGVRLRLISTRAALVQPPEPDPMSQALADALSIDNRHG